MVFTTTSMIRLKRSTLRVKPTRTYPRLHIDTAPSNALGHPGGLLLTETVQTSGLGHHLMTAMEP